MSESNAPLLAETLQNGCLTLTLSRPDVHNAFNDQLIALLRDALLRAKTANDVRLIVIAGEGRSFCAGADLTWMKAMVDASLAQNKADALELVKLLDVMVEHEKPIIARVHGAALGGGMGLVAACDLVVAAPRATFGLTEVRLGLVPAMIFPYLLRKMARHELLWAALTGERFGAERAHQMGLVNVVTEQLDAEITKLAACFGQNGPQAMAAVKRLFNEVPRLSAAEARELTVDVIARARTGVEGQEGMKAFLQKRQAAWKLEEPQA
jgi:methylglutaconyl-CoA hydratase